MNTILINLDKRPDRLARSTEQLTKAGVPFQRFPAIDGNKYNGISALKRGVIGCSLSHYLIIKMAKMLAWDSVMIFEDDIELCDEFFQKLQACTAQLPEDWGMLYLGGSHRQKPEPVAEFLSKVIETYTTHAYIIRNSVFDIVLNEIEKQETAVDVIFASLQSSIDAYVTNPPLAWQVEGFSDIENRVMNYPWLKTNNQ